MNTLGIQRGYMAKNMKAEEFINVVIAALSREFEKEVKLEIIDENGFKITMKSYEVVMSRDLINKLLSPYGVDRYMLQEFEKQGFKFDRNRSQYIKYCFGMYNGAK